MQRQLLVLSLAALLLPGVLASSPQSETEQDNFIYADAVDVEVVEVNVQVTDNQGNPITGLTREDFEVFEDGDPERISNFRIVEIPKKAPILRRPLLPPPPDPEDKPVAEATAPQIATTPEIQPINLVFYIDNANIRTNHRKRVLRELREFVAGVDVRSRMMLVSYEKGLHIRQPFTESASAIIDAIVNLEEKPAFGDTSQDVFRDLLHEIEDRDAKQHWIENRVRGHADTMKNELDLSLRALRELVETLGGLPGRKALVYVSDGLPLNPAEELFHAMEIRFQDMNLLSQSIAYNSSRDFQQLAQVANTAEVAFYSIHAAGLEAPLTSDAEMAGSSYDGLRQTVESVRLGNFQGSGRMLASETGGLAILNQNDFGTALERMIEDLSLYYSLGYQPSHGGDGRYHKIEVKVKDRSLKVRHRRGYRDRSLSVRMQEMVNSAVHYGQGDNPLGIDLSVDLAASTDDPSDNRTNVVKVRVGVPMGRIVFLPGQDDSKARIRIYVAVQNEKGDTSPVQEIEVPIRIPAESLERAMSQNWVQEVQLRMRPGPHLLAVGVWDEIGRTSSVAFLRFEIAD